MDGDKNRAPHIDKSICWGKIVTICDRVDFELVSDMFAQSIDNNLIRYKRKPYLQLI